MLALSQLPPFEKDVLSTFMTRIVGLACSLTSAAILAWTLGPEGKGQVTLALTLPAFLSLLLNFGVSAANVYHMGTNAFPSPVLIGNSLVAALVSTGIAAVALAALMISGGLSKLVPSVPGSLLLSSSLTIPTMLLLSNLQGVLRGSQRVRQANITTLIQSFFNVILVLLLVGLLRTAAIGAVLAAFLSGLAGCVAAIWMLRRHGLWCRLRWEWLAMKRTLSFGLEAYIGNVLQYFNYRADTFVINYFLGPSPVGLYSAAVALAEVLWYLPNAVGFVIFPKAATSSRKEMDAFTPRVFRATLLFTLAGSLGLVILGQILIRLVFSPAFAPAYQPMLILLPGVILLGGGKVLTNELAGRGKPLLNSLNSCVALLATLLFDFLLIPPFGINGAAAASTISYALTFVIAVASYLTISQQSFRQLLLASSAGPMDRVNDIQ